MTEIGGGNRSETINWKLTLFLLFHKLLHFTDKCVFTEHLQTGAVKLNFLHMWFVFGNGWQRVWRLDTWLSLRKSAWIKVKAWKMLASTAVDFPARSYHSASISYLVIWIDNTLLMLYLHDSNIYYFRLPHEVIFIHVRVYTKRNTIFYERNLALAVKISRFIVIYFYHYLGKTVSIFCLSLSFNN